MTKLLTVQAWIDLHYDAGSAPSVRTVRRWIDDGKIYPKPQKQGRAYFFRADAQYVDSRAPRSRLLERIA